MKSDANDHIIIRIKKLYISTPQEGKYLILKLLERSKLQDQILKRPGEFIGPAETPCMF